MLLSILKKFLFYRKAGQRARAMRKNFAVISARGLHILGVWFARQKDFL